MQLEVYLYSFEERYHQNTVSLFFESLLKLSEGGEMKKCWITQRWKRSMYKQKRVLTNHELYFCAQKDTCILYLSIISKVPDEYPGKTNYSFKRNTYSNISHITTLKI